MERVPLEPPHPALHGHVSQWPPQTPRVPEENMLVVAATHESQAVCGKAGLRGQGTSQETWTRPSRTQSLPEPPTPTLWFKEQPGLMSQRPQAEAAPQPGLTFPWPTRSHGGGCSGCCTRPWSVCGGGGLSRRPAAPQQKLGAGPGGAAREGWPHEDSPAAAEGGCAGRPGVPALQEAIVPTCRETEPVPPGQEARCGCAAAISRVQSRP